MKLSKSDLIFKNYDWPEYPDNDPRVHGQLGPTPFNRYEGPEVVHLIEEICALLQLMLKESAREIEIQIQNELPSDIRTQENVLEWVLAHRH